MSQTKQQGLITKTCFNSFFKRMHLSSMTFAILNEKGVVHDSNNNPIKYTILQIMIFGDNEAIIELIETELYLGELPFA